MRPETQRGSCTVCGATTLRRHFKLCLACYRQHAERERAANDALWTELAENLPRLIQLAHPDRHGGSALATTTTQWLLDVRERLEREREVA